MTEIKRRTKRLFAALLGLLMALSLLSTTAFADNTTTITIKKPTGITADWAGMTVTAYRVLTASEDGNTYTAHADFEDFFDIDSVKGFFGDHNADGSNDNTTVYLTYADNHLTARASSTNPGNEIVITSTDALDATYPESDLVSRIESSGTGAKNGDISVLYTWLEKYIESKESFTQTPMTETADTGTDSLSVDVRTKGYYALIFSNVPSSISTIQGILVKTADGGTAIDLKAEQVPLNKQVINEQHQDEEFVVDDPGATDNKETSADIGDTLTYQILTKVPTLADTENLTVFALSDTLQNQQLNGTMTLTLSKEGSQDIVFTASLPTTENLHPYFADSTGEKKIAKLTVLDYANKAQSFEVNFLPTVGTTPDLTPDNEITVDLTDYQGYQVKLTYTAVLTADAQQVNGNDVTLDYTNNDSESKQTDHTDVYTYGIEVQKKFSDGSIDKYGDVTFSLYPDVNGSKGDDALHFVEMSTGVSGSYRKPVGSSETGDTVLKLDGSGKLTITGLDVGTYWLVENKTADGYTKSEDIQIVLTADTTNKEQLDDTFTTAKIGGTGKNLATVDNDTGSISLARFDVLNQKGFELPETGGAGTWMFTIGGILLVVAAGVLFVLSRKKDGSK